MHQALYRKWRPLDFDSVCGQEHITSVLKYECMNNKFSHAYLFCGSRGTGKTTCAKILAKAVNCETPENGNPCGKCPSCIAIENGSTTDVLEMDAASNNSVENIRDIRDEVAYAPSVLKFRVYIVDEVHMLSNSAFNALLKTLEEPPSHVVFILATTELNKLPATIISRCQRFDFRRISIPVITERLLQISKSEEIEIETEAAQLIAKLAQGGMRDAVSLLELCAGNKKKITTETVNETVGISGKESIVRLVCAIAEKNYDVIFSEISEISASSKDMSVFWQDLLGFYRDMLVVKTTENAASYLDLTESEAKQTKKVAEFFTKETLISHCRIIDSTLVSMQKNNTVKRLCAEMALINMCDESLDVSPQSIISRISVLEDKIAASDFTQSSNRAKNDKKQKVADTQKNEVDAVSEKAHKKEEKQEPHSAKKRALPYWAEAIEKAGRDDPSVSGFLKSSKLYKNESGTIVLRLESDFAEKYVKLRMHDSIAPLISSYEKRNVSPDEILCEISHENDIIDVGREAINEILDTLDSN